MLAIPTTVSKPHSDSLPPTPCLLSSPPAGVLAIPADVSNPASHFDALLAQLPLPPLMAQDVMYTLRDRDFPRHYLLLWDAADGSSDRKWVQWGKRGDVGCGAGVRCACALVDGCDTHGRHGGAV